MKKLISAVTALTMLLSSAAAQLTAKADTAELTASENVVLQSTASKYTANTNLRVKASASATKRVSFIRFNYSSYNVGDYGEIKLGLYVKKVSGTAQQDTNTAHIYWSGDNDAWSAANNAVNYNDVLPNMKLTEVGSNIIQIPKISQDNQQMYYYYDVTSAVKANAADGKSVISFVLQQDDVSDNGNCGLDFASISESGHEPKLTFTEGTYVKMPEVHIANGEAVLNTGDVTVSGAVNYGGADSISVSGKNNEFALVKFDLSAYSKENIGGAGLRMYISEADTCNNTLLKVSGIGGGWDESAVTETNAPEDGNSYTDYSVSYTKGSGYWIDIDVSDIIADAEDLSEVAFRISQIDSGSDGIKALSKENSTEYAPHLVIRPAFTEDAEKIVSAAASDDTYVRFDNTSSVEYSSQNFNKQYLQTKLNDNAERKIFVKFDFSGTNTDLENATANLKLYYTPKSGTGVDNETDIDVYYCPDSSWEEDTLTADTARSMVEAAYTVNNYAGSVKLGVADTEKGWYNINVSDFVKAHLNDSYTRTITFMLTQSNTAGSNGGASFYDKENSASFAPTLEIYPDIPAGYAAAPVTGDTYVQCLNDKWNSNPKGAEAEMGVINKTGDVRNIYIKADITALPDGDAYTLLLPVLSANLAETTLNVYGTYSADEWSDSVIVNSSLGGYSLGDEEFEHIADVTVVKKTDVGGYIKIDVSEFVQEAIDFAADEVSFKIAVENDGTNNLVKFYTRETLYKPMIAYSAPVTAIELVDYNTVSDGDKIIASAKIRGRFADAPDGFTVNAAKDITVIGAGYSEEGALTGVDVQNITAGKYNSNYETTADGAAYFKLLVWENTDTMKPCDVIYTEDGNLEVASASYYADPDYGLMNAEIAPALEGDDTDYLRGSEKVVVAALMANHRISFISGEWRHWNNTAHKPYTVDSETGLRDIPSADYPSIGLFDVSDPDYVEYEMQLMKMAGIDAVSININGDYADEAWKISNIKNNIVPALKKYGLKGFARIASPTADGYTDAEICEMIYMFGNTILEVENRPVISFFASASTAAAYTPVVKAAYEAANGVTPFVMNWLSNWSESGSQTVLDGLYSWTNTEATNGAEYSSTEEYGRYYNVEQAKESYVADILTAKKIFMRSATDDKPLDFCADSTTPAFDNLPVNGWDGKNTVTKTEAGENGEVYKFRWANAANNQFPMVFIPTWDDWSEGTQIMPTLKNGNMNLLITRHYSALYKGTAEDTTADFNIADLIYKIRKTTSDAAVLYDMERASSLIAGGSYTEAGNIVFPYAVEMNIPNTAARFGY